MSDPPVPLRIVGLDLSLTSTGLARIDGADTTIARIQPGKRKGHDRLTYLRSEIVKRCAGADLAVVEGPSYNSAGGREHERGGLWWMITHELWLSCIPYAVVPPANLKMYATGFGGGPRSGKDQVLAAVIRRYTAVPVDGNDVADALVLAAMGADHAGVPYAGVPKANRRALDKIDWPAL